MPVVIEAKAYRIVLICWLMVLFVEEQHWSVVARLPSTWGGKLMTDFVIRLDGFLPRGKNLCELIGIKRLCVRVCVA